MKVAKNGRAADWVQSPAHGLNLLMSIGCWLLLIGAGVWIVKQLHIIAAILAIAAAL